MYICIFGTVLQQIFSLSNTLCSFAGLFQYFFFNIFIFGFSCLFTNTHGNYAATIVYLYLLDVLHFASVSLRALDFLLFN